MPISSPAAGTDAAFVPSGGRSGLTLDYGSRDRGPSFRRVLQEAAVPQPVATVAPAAAGPVGGGDAAPAGMAPVGTAYEGADALSQLRRDLLSGGATLIDPPPADPVAIDPTPAEAPPPESAETAVLGAAPARPVAWHHDDIRGRRLGDHQAPSAGRDGVENWLFGEDGFGFDDLIDVVNPLQHIPIVSSIYRWITGDEIAPAASIAGGALFGGPLGLAGAAASVAVEEATGRDVGGHAIAMVFGDDAATGEGADQPAAAIDLAMAPSHGPAIGEEPEIATPVLPPVDVAAVPPPAAAPAHEQLVAVEPARTPGSGTPILFIPAPSAAPGDSLPAAPPVEALSPADAAIAAQMKLALDKYEALVRQRAAAPPGGSAGSAAADRTMGGSAMGAPATGSLYDGRL